MLAAKLKLRVATDIFVTVMLVAKLQFKAETDSRPVAVILANKLTT